jgi:uncharacterized protein (UPF0335 family)
MTTTTIGSNTVAADQLRSVVERIERMEAEKKDIAIDISEIYREAKGNGYDVKAIRAIIKERAQDKAKREEMEYILDTYRHALGMLSDTPLGEAAMERAGR